TFSQSHRTAAIPKNRLAEAIGALRAGAYIEKDGTPRRFPHDNRISIALGTRRVVPSRHSMGDGWSVTFENVEVVSVTTQRTAGWSESGWPAPGRVSRNVSPNADHSPSPGSRGVALQASIRNGE